MSLQSVNPATGEILRSFEPLSQAALQARIAFASEAFQLRAHVPAEHRSLCLRKLAALLDEEAVEVARTVALETGKPIRASRSEVARCASVCRHYAEHAARLLAPELLPFSEKQTYQQWGPMGVVLAVMSWESPLWHVFRFAIPALLAGNVILLKHAASVPQCALLIESLVRRAGFARAALSALLIEEHMTEAVLRDERVAAVTVTAPEQTARALAAQAGSFLKKSAVHLPGSDVLIVMPSADLDAAVAAAVHMLAGELAGTRIVLHSAVMHEFMGRFIPEVEALRIGDPLRDETDVGPLGTAEALRSLEDHVDAAVKAGGRVLTGGACMVGRGNYFEPTLLSDVPPDSVVARSALLGPVALLFRARHAQEAVAMANEMPTGRVASVWTREPNEQQQLIDGIHAECIALNALPVEEVSTPWGGGMREFMRSKIVLLT